MKCPTCQSWAKVLETRTRRDGSIRRRYQCAKLHKFTTEEKTVSNEKELPPVLSTLPRVSPHMPKLKNLV